MLLKEISCPAKIDGASGGPISYLQFCFGRSFDDWPRLAGLGGKEATMEWQHVVPYEYLITVAGQPSMNEGFVKNKNSV